jgi:hypothetical protein
VQVQGALGIPGLVTVGSQAEVEHYWELGLYVFYVQDEVHRVGVLNRK